jgi:hypothetical protein
MVIDCFYLLFKQLPFPAQVSQLSIVIGASLFPTVVEGNTFMDRPIAQLQKK